MTLQLAEIKTRLTTFEKQPLSSEGLYELQKSLRFLALAMAAYPLYENETMSTGDYSTNANIIQIKQDILQQFYRFEDLKTQGSDFLLNHPLTDVSSNAKVLYKALGSLTINQDGTISVDKAGYLKTCDLDGSKCISAFKKITRVLQSKFKSFVDQPTNVVEIFGLAPTNQSNYNVLVSPQL